MKLTCSKCYGNKTYRGMGSMIIKCEPCSGTGSVNIEAEAEAAVDTLKKVIKKPRKGLTDEERSRNTQAE